MLAVLPKRLRFTKIKKADFNGSIVTNPYKFRHYIVEFSLCVNGKCVPSEGLTLDMDDEKCLLWAIEHCFKGPAYIIRTRDYR